MFYAFLTVSTYVLYFNQTIKEGTNKLICNLIYYYTKSKHMYPTEIIGKEFIPYYGIKEIIQVQFNNIAFKIFHAFFSRGSQRDVVYLGWRIAPWYMSPNAGGGLRVLSQWVQLCMCTHTLSPNKLWRFNSILNLWFSFLYKARYCKT